MASKQFAALPFRRRKAGLDVLLITTRRKRRWSLPKGWPMPEKAPSRTAAIEAYEEAGLLGKVGSKRIGRYKHRKQKGRRNINCDIEVFPLEVKRQKKRWPERGQRKMVWLPARDAAQKVHKAELSRMISRFARRNKKKSR